MSQKLIWQDNWLLGIDDLDAEHQEMVRSINRLVDEDDSISVLQRAEDLMNLLRRHFSREEAFLRNIEYPDYHAHKNEHHMELIEMMELLRKTEFGTSIALDSELFLNLKYWFLNHAVLEDKRFAEFYFHEFKGNSKISAPQ